MEIGISLSALMQSDIFIFEFDYDEWPGIHENDQELLRPYNKSIFDLVHNYETVFPEKRFAPPKDDDGTGDAKRDSTKIYKIKYSINLLPESFMYITWSPPPKGISYDIKNFINPDNEMI